MTQPQHRAKHNIAMVCDFFYPRLGGVENHIYNLAHQLIQLGHKVIVITNAYDENKNKDNDSRRRIGVRYLPGPLKVYYCPFLCMTDQDTLPTFLASLPLLRHIWIREQISIVHCHQATSTMAHESMVYAAIMTMGRTNIRSVYTDHSLFGIDDDIASVVLNRVLQISLSTVNAIICVSYACRDNLVLRTKQQRNRKSGSKTTGRIIRVIPNAVSSEKFQPKLSSLLTTRNVNDEGDTEKDHYDGNRIRIVVISRLVYRKGIDLLVGIIPEVCSKYETVDFIIGGDGNKLLSLQEMIEREQLQDRVTCLGSVPHAAVRNVLCEGHIFLNCSLTESFCIAILEAASSGMIVVSTNVGGIPEVLPSDMIYLANPTVTNLVNQIDKAIIQCQKEKQLAAMFAKTEINKKTIGTSTAATVKMEDNRKNIQHERVAEMYSWERVALETIDVYDAILKEYEDQALEERLMCYYSSLNGGICGFAVSFLLVLTIEMWFCFIDWWFPRGKIDVIPNITHRQKTSLSTLSSSSHSTSIESKHEVGM